MQSHHACLLRCIEKRYRGAFQARSARRQYGLKVAHIQATLELELFDFALWEHTCIIALHSEWDPEAAQSPCVSCGKGIHGVQVCAPDGGCVHWDCAPIAVRDLATLGPRVARHSFIDASTDNSLPHVTNPRLAPRVVAHPHVPISKPRFSPRSTHSRCFLKPHIPSHAVREMELSGLIDHGAQSGLSYALDKLRFVRRVSEFPGVQGLHVAGCAIESSFIGRLESFGQYLGCRFDHVRARVCVCVYVRVSDS